jgi:LSD1 subclass zinc finger protein
MMSILHELFITQECSICRVFIEYLDGAAHMEDAS